MTTSLSSPDIECQLATKINYLRQSFKINCLRLLNVKHPGDAFDRWIFNQLTVANTQNNNPITTFLKAPQLATESRVLKRELFKLVPAPLYLSWNARNSLAAIKKLIATYIQKGNQWLLVFEQENNDLKDDVTFNQLKQRMIHLGNWLTKNLSLSVTRKKLTGLQHSSMFHHLFASRIHFICQNLTDTAHTIINVKIKSTINCSVKIAILSDKVNVCYQNDCFTINLDVYQKLKRLYQLNKTNNEHSFVQSLYTLLRRYETLFGKGETIQFHAAVTPTLFQFLTVHFKVHHECFASPLNCYYDSYNSAFIDTDGPFGSNGSFFDFYPTNGSFQVNPPYTEEVILETAKHIIQLLSVKESALSFIVFVPNWTEPLSEGLFLMNNSSFNVTEFILAGNNHQYVKGNSQKLSTNKYFTAPFDTKVYFLQNDAGVRKWPVTHQKINLLKKLVNEQNENDLHS